MKPLDISERRELFGPGDDPHDARFDPFTTMAVVGGAASLASTGMSIASAVTSTPKVPQIPGQVVSEKIDAAARAEALAAKSRMGRASTILTRGKLGTSDSLSTSALPPKTLLGV